jgi:hypothetical protein
MYLNFNNFLTLHLEKVGCFGRLFALSSSGNIFMRDIIQNYDIYPASSTSNKGLIIQNILGNVSCENIYAQGGSGDL